MRSAKLSCEHLLYTKRHEMMSFIARPPSKVPLLRAAFHLKLPSLIGVSFYFLYGIAEVIVSPTTKLTVLVL